MLKTATLPEKSIFVGVGDGESGDCISIKIAKKSGKLKGQKTSKSQKSAKSKKPSKNGNLPNFNTKDSGPGFLIPKARAAFNCLQLTFTEALILWHFDLECHIQIEIDLLDYAINGVLSQLASGTSSDGEITKADLGQWQPVEFFSRKMIFAKTQYKT